MKMPSELERPTPSPNAARAEEDSAGDSLSARARAGVGWSAASVLLARAVGFARAVVLARLLVPDDFGVFSMGLTVVVALDSLTRTGLEMAVIAKPYSDREELRAHLDTVWTVELLKRCLLALVILAVAAPAARFYHSDELRAMLPVFGLVYVVKGMASVGLVALRKQINFRRIFWYELTAGATAAAATVALALLWRDAWALVWGELVGAAVGALASYAFYPGRPRLALARDALRRTLGFGKHVFVIGVASYVTTTFDNIAVGRLLGASALGAYAVAYNLANLPAFAVADVSNKVAFPFYAELRALHPEKLEETFARGLAASAAALVVISAPLCLLAEEFVFVVYGEKWSAAGEVLRVLAGLGVVRGLVLIVTSVLFGLDRPKAVARGKLFEAAAFLVLLYPMVSALGVAGAAWAGVIVYSLALIHRLKVIGDVVPRAPRRALGILLSACASGLGGVAAGAVAVAAVERAHYRLAVGAPVAAVASALLVWWLVRDLPDARAFALPFRRRRG